MSRVVQRAIILGGVTDVVASNLASIPILVTAASRTSLDHLHGSEQSAAVMHVIQSVPRLFAAAVIVGTACSMLGGYVAARIAKHDEALNGALSAWLCIVTGVYEMSIRWDFMGPVAQVAGLIASPLLGALGGYIAMRTRS